MKYVKRIVILLVLALLIFLFFRTTSETHNLVICGSYAVPGMVCYDLKGRTYQCEIMETDSQDRILFSYTTDSVITGQQESALVICQEIGMFNVYFYEDQCYLVGDYTESDIARLKEQNDWEKPLNRSKMSKRSNALTLDLCFRFDFKLEFNDVRSACCSTFGVLDSQVKELSLLNVDPSYQGLFWCVLDRDGITEKYLVLVSTDYKVCYIDAAEGNIDAAEVATFKRDNGWTYG